MRSQDRLELLQNLMALLHRDVGRRQLQREPRAGVGVVAGDLAAMLLGDRAGDREPQSPVPAPELPPSQRTR